MPGRWLKNFLRSFFSILLFLFTLTAWWMGDAVHSSDLPEPTRKLLKEEEKKILGTLTTLFYSLQFYLYGEKSLPPNLETLAASVYFPLNFTELRNFYHNRQVNFYSYLQVQPTFPVAGDFNLRIEVAQGLRLSAFLPDFSLSPPSAFSVSLLLSPQVMDELTRRYDLTPEALWDIKALSAEEQRLYWQCQHLFAAGQLLAYQAFPPWKNSPEAPSHFSDFHKYPFVMNFHFPNVLTRKPLKEVPVTRPSPGDISIVMKTLKGFGGGPTRSGEKKIPIFIGYKKDGKPVNPAALKYFEITLKNPPEKKSPKPPSPLP